MSYSSRTEKIIRYTILILGALVMVYPLIWLFFSAFKPGNEIFNTSQLLPTEFTTIGFREGWRGSGQYTFGTYILNTFKLVIPVVAATVISPSLVAFGFARFDFPLKKICFNIMIATMMLPSSVMLIPRYLMYRDMGWLDTYLPFIVPALFATNAFFIFMFIQFFRGLPRELDESARIDGCSSWRLFVSILLPLSKPAIFSAVIFQFMWTWNDFFGPLIHINSVHKYPLVLGLRMSMDVTTSTNWNNVLAMALVSVLPLIVLFFSAQKHFIEGVATTGLKA